MAVLNVNPVDYDAWYDRHPDIYRAELEALAFFTRDYRNPMLEVGVGTGRFAAPLGVKYGIDPHGGMLSLAAGRGVEVVRGVGEMLPFKDAVFNMVLMVATLSFVDNPGLVLREVRRVLVPGGGLVLAFIPRDSCFGRRYSEKFKGARFHSFGEVLSLLERTSFEVRGVKSTVVDGNVEAVFDGYVVGASFVVVCAHRRGTGSVF